ncbi:MAG: SDR family oxidoreductase [Solirubrobacteraceae bacterium]|jgi:NAD(P)-dependent dehydrogenase (short-subunit alcohol dehydrogenase family)|nr:SDR family oxidoreductase [Solirubrobacteraceae bacterium]MDP4672996.1 SDR family oxidoreductase [Solirubrobacteraceae bacterium]MDP4921421.1 SDR family oxidoreductase [Solirubrobacteraceae bacterium]
MTTYLVTGATGFIGGNLAQRLLARGDTVHAIVREGSRERFEAKAQHWPGGENLKVVSGDLLEPMMGVGEEWIAEHRGKIDHAFHLAAIYDMTASEARNEELNTGGTAHLLELVAELQPGTLHHVSSVAVAGSYEGVFTEQMFDEGQTLPSPYHRTKFESEKLVREMSAVPWRIYRPAVVIGDSRTGKIDKVDGPYYFFKAIRRARNVLPSWLPLVGPEIGETNIVPVDFVADAIVEIAHKPGLDGSAFHLASPKMISSAAALNDFAKAADAPHLALRLPPGPLDPLTAQTNALLRSLPGVTTVADTVLDEFGIPAEVIEHTGFTCSFDTTQTDAALAGSGIEVPALADYAQVIWDYWENHLDAGGFASSSLRAALNGRTVVITGGSSGIGRSAALEIAAAGGTPLLVARSLDKLEEVKAEIELAGGSAYCYSADLSDMESIDELVTTILAQHASVDMIVNNAGRSIRRSLANSLDRFHDYERTMQLNYFGAIRLVMGFIPHMQQRRFGHIVNVSSIGVQASPPRFGAYVASKAALDAWTRVVSSELIGDNITFTTIHMPLVRTPMIAPTKMYDHFPAISPDEAGSMVCDALRRKPKQINTRLGTVAEVGYALAPKLLDQILNAAFRVFPESAASSGREAAPEQKASIEQMAMANLMKGVHW